MLNIFLYHLQWRYSYFVTCISALQWPFHEWNWSDLFACIIAYENLIIILICVLKSSTNFFCDIEMEAKLENNNDERRILLERQVKKYVKEYLVRFLCEYFCIYYMLNWSFALTIRCLTSEEECEKLRQKSTDLKRKLDDTQAALQELGRENQSLQVKNELGRENLSL